MRRLDINLREYLQQNHNQFTWKERIKIIYDIVDALDGIHDENAIHRDLHSGNILYLQYNDYWCISDFGFCGPADKTLGSIYGNLPYIAPEVIVGKESNFASDIYSIGMLMWEISSGQPPFRDYDNYDLAINIINGIRPKTISGIPLEYKDLMEQCWDANPTKRPDISTLFDKIDNINKSYHQNKFNLFESSKSEANNIKANKTNSLISNKSFTSKIYQFNDLPEPKNATEGIVI